MLIIEDLGDFISARLVTPPPFAYNHTPDSPDRVITLAEISGPKDLTLEGATDMAGVQVRCRSPVNEAKEARDLAHSVDRVIMDDSLYPLILAGTPVIDAERIGSAPVYFRTDHEDRQTYMCNYWFRVLR